MLILHSSAFRRYICQRGRRRGKTCRLSGPGVRELGAGDREAGNNEPGDAVTEAIDQGGLESRDGDNNDKGFIQSDSKEAGGQSDVGPGDGGSGGCEEVAVDLRDHSKFYQILSAL